MVYDRDSREQADGKLIVSDLVTSFLIPHVEREIVREQGKKNT